MTKMEMFSAIKEMIANNVKPSDAFDADAAEAVIAMLDSQMAQLVKHAERTKLRAANARAANDELKAVVYEALSDEYQTVDQLMEQFDDDTLTRQKLINRLTALVKDGSAQRDEIKVDGKRGKATVYRRAVEEA